MIKKDFKLITIIGAGVGLLIQPIADNLIRGSQTFANLVGSDALTPTARAVIFFIFLFFAPFALWIAHLLSKAWIAIYQFAKFAAVGTLNTFINFGVLNLQSLLTGITAGPFIPVFATVSFLAATTNSFFWNKFWTFDSAGKPEAKETIKFYLISIGSWVLNVGTVSFVVNYLRPAGISPELWLNIGGLCGTAASFLSNFLGYKYIVFKKPDSIAPTSL